MKKIIVIVSILLLGSLKSFAQDWMSSLDIAKRLALTQNKMILMVWEEASLYPLPFFFNDTAGRKILLENVFETPEINQLLWQYFVPVKINELLYEDMYNEIKGVRNKAYIDKFNDDSFKVMDVNGNIINQTGYYEGLLDLSKFIAKYGLNTSYVNQELKNYRHEKTVYTTFYLGSKYIDYSIYVNKDVSVDILKLSNIYLKEAKNILEKENPENKAELGIRFLLLELKQDLILNKPRRVLRRLKKIDTSKIEGANKSLAAFLNFTSYMLLKDDKNITLWRPEVSLINLNKAQRIINNTK